MEVWEWFMVEESNARWVMLFLIIGILALMVAGIIVGIQRDELIKELEIKNQAYFGLESAANCSTVNGFQKGAEFVLMAVNECRIYLFNDDERFWLNRTCADERFNQITQAELFKNETARCNGGN